VLVTVTTVMHAFDSVAGRVGDCDDCDLFRGQFLRWFRFRYQIGLMSHLKIRKQTWKFSNLNFKIPLSGFQRREKFNLMSKSKSASEITQNLVY
jgi:hypothetical protein